MVKTLQLNTSMRKDNPAGHPMRVSSRILTQSMAHADRDPNSALTDRLKNAVCSITTCNPWAITVAAAAPAMPH